jgi:hypothetical protein
MYDINKVNSNTIIDMQEGCQVGGGGLLTGIDKVGYILLLYYWLILWLSLGLSSFFEGILCGFGGYFNRLSLSFYPADRRPQKMSHCYEDFIIGGNSREIRR